MKKTASVLDELSADELSAVIKRIICLRSEYLHMTQADFSERLGISQSYISSLEQGRKPLSYSLFEKITRIFSIERSWLLTGKGSMTEEKPTEDPFLAWYYDLPEKEKRRLFNAIREISSICRDYPPGS